MFKYKITIDLAITLNPLENYPRRIVRELMKSHFKEEELINMSALGTKKGRKRVPDNFRKFIYGLLIYFKIKFSV